MSKRDYYEVLGLAKDCSAEDIKKAYRSLAKQYHPDVNKTSDAEAKFKEAKEAYDVLSDDQRRSQYDQFGHIDPNQGMGGADFSGAGGFGDIFDMFFGQQTNRRNPNAPQRGSDLQYTTTIEFKEAVFGKQLEVVIPRTENCESCSGTGARKGTKPDNCSVCKGSGQQEFVQNTAFGRIVNRRVCPGCNGQGSVIKDKCQACSGSGKIKNRRKINVKIPAGIDEGAQIRVSGEGESGSKGGPAGDLYVVIRIKNHEFFEREGYDIYCEVPLTFTQAALGDEIEIPTLTEKVKLKIPAGTQTSTLFRLKGKGVPHLRGSGHGDQHVKVTVVTPTSMTEEQRQHLNEFARLSGEQTHSQSQSIFERMKRAVLGD